MNDSVVDPLEAHCTSTIAKQRKTNQNEHSCADAPQPGTVQFQFWEIVTRPEQAFGMRYFLLSSSKFPKIADKHPKAYMVKKGKETRNYLK